MLTTKLINPELVKALSLCGHGDKILISDGNYPLNSKSGDAQKIYLSLTKGSPTVTEILDALKTVMNFEKAEFMMPDGDKEPEIFEEFRDRLPEAEFEYHSRFGFYDVCEQKDVKVAIHSGESRVYANILLTVGVA